MARLNPKQIATAYAGATVASVSTSLVGSFIWQRLGGVEVDTALIVSSAWFLTVGIPSVIVSAESLRHTLGEKSPNTVTAIGGGRHRRAIPFSINGRQSHVFLSAIPWLKSQEDTTQPQIELPTIFTAIVDDTSHSVTVDELEHFLRGAWRRQRLGEAPFSRPFWTRQSRPRLKPLEYYARLNVLLSVEGLILDRQKRRSGKLSVPPMMAIKALQSQFSLV